MLLLAGQTAIAQFQVSVGTDPVNLDSATAVVIRNGIDTAIAPTITNNITGQYLISFAIPVNWVFPDHVAVRLSGTVNGLTAQLTKEIGQVVETNVDEAIAQTLQTTTDISDRVTKQVKALGLISGVSATAKEPTTEADGFLRTSDGAVDLVLTLEPDGSTTISE